MLWVGETGLIGGGFERVRERGEGENVSCGFLRMLWKLVLRTRRGGRKRTCQLT
jgi:hypothetical protein